MIVIVMAVYVHEKVTSPVSLFRVSTLMFRHCFVFAIEVIGKCQTAFFFQPHSATEATYHLIVAQA